jgi:hypothetical protein
MHVIRLRKPWMRTREPGDSTDDRVDVPDLDQARAIPVDSVLVYRRKFNRPTKLSNARVYLSISEWRGQLESVMLNGDAVPCDASWTCFRQEITSRLKLHNELVIRLAQAPESAPRLSGEVSLVIEELVSDESTTT